MNVAAIAATGMRNAALRLDAAAAGVAAAAPADPGTSPPLLVHALSAVQARSDFQANAVVLRRVEAALGTLFDAFA